MDAIESIGTASVLAPGLENIQDLSSPERSASQSLQTVAGRSDAEKEKLAKDFESVFLIKLFDQVKDSIGGWGGEEDGASQQIHGLFWYYLAQDVGAKGGFGLWRDIYQSFQTMEAAGAAGEAIDREL